MHQITRSIFSALVVAAVSSFGATTTMAAGALAVGGCGAYGQAFGFKTVQAARRSALQKCPNGGCRIVATLSKSCAALAVDVENPCAAHGAGTAVGLGAAQNDALRLCYGDGGKDCVIRTFVCDGKS